MIDFDYFVTIVFDVFNSDDLKLNFDIVFCILKKGKKSYLNAKKYFMVFGFFV